MIEVNGQSYSQVRLFKNDFFAATALYEPCCRLAPTLTGVGADAGKIILKVQRQASFLLIPLGWVGRLLAAREAAALNKLSGVPGVPRLIGRWGRTGIVREYIEGRTLSPKEHVPDDFHERLRALIETIHARDMAYVDLEKCENVLVGDDGRPYLFDFQIAWHWPRRWGGELPPARLLRRWFQAGDRYHLIKQHRRTRPDQLTAEARAASYAKPWFVRLHHFITRPFTRARRAVLNRIDPRGKRGERGRIDENEIPGRGRNEIPARREPARPVLSAKEFQQCP